MAIGAAIACPGRKVISLQVHHCRVFLLLYKPPINPFPLHDLDGAMNALGTTSAAATL